MSAATTVAVTSTRRTARWVALACLGLWGVLHVFGGLSLVLSAAGDGPAAGLETLTSETNLAALPGASGDVTEAVLVFLGLVITAAGVAVALLALSTARVAWPSGITASLVIVAVLDAAFVVTLLTPGHVSLADGMWGPVLFVISSAAAWRAGWRPTLR